MAGAPFGLHSAVRARIATILVSVAVIVYGCEAFLFWDPLEFRGPHPRQGFDTRDYFDVVYDLRAKGLSAYPVLAAHTWFDSPPRVHDTPIIPLSSVPLATIVMCNETGSYVTYQSDRFGFNGPDSQWDMPAEVALVGDSFVEGWCVTRESSFSGLIRRAVPATLTVGYAGDGPLAELATIREYVAPRRPAHVFWFFYEGNDLTTDLPREMESAILRRYLEPGFTQQLQRDAATLGAEIRRKFDSRFASWKPQPSEIPGAGIIKLRTLRGLVKSSLLRHASESESAGRIDDLRTLENLRIVLAEAQRSVSEWGGSLHFVYLPDFLFVIGERDLDNHDRVLALAADLGLAVIDLFPEFKNHAAPRSLFPFEEGRHLVRTQGLHYAPEGHRLVARRVIDVIQQMSN